MPTVNLKEYVIDRLRHPKYGSLTWERSNGTDVIRRDGRVVHTDDSGTHVAKIWKELKTAVVTKESKRIASGVRMREDEGEMNAGEMDGNDRHTKPTTTQTAYEWISNFDIKEISTAIEKIVEYLPEIEEDDEQTHLLRNDIRILDNLGAAMRAGKPGPIHKAWSICVANGAADHLHNEFAKKMNASGSSDSSMQESFAQFCANRTSGVFTSLTEWKTASTAQSLRIVESNGFQDAHRLSGELAGSWARGIGWLVESEYDGEDDNDDHVADVESQFVARLTQELVAGRIDYKEFKRKLDQAEQTNYTMRQGELGLYDGDTPSGHRAWDQERRDWDTMGDDEVNDFDDSDLDDEEFNPRRSGRSGVTENIRVTGPRNSDRDDRDDWDDYNDDPDFDDGNPDEFTTRRRPRPPVQSNVRENAPADQEQWIKSNKQSFVARYGDKRGAELLYATAWKRHNQQSGK